VNNIYTAIALCAAGAEKVVSNELKKLAGRVQSLSIIESGFGKVRFKTDLGGLYRSLFCLRAADRVLLEAASFPAPDFDALFEKTGAVHWDDFVRRGMGLHVGKVRTNRSALKAETSIQASVHKAAAGKLCGCFGLNRLPEAGDAEQVELRVYIEKDIASLLIDISGEPLFKRGYRREGGIAPLRETTAAAIILLSGWKRKFPLYDPLCGSGTIAIEAAMYAWNVAPGIGRNFSLDGLAIADSHLSQEIRKECAARTDFGNRIRIYGSDADENALSLAKANAVRAKSLVRKQLSGTPSGPENVPAFQALPMEKARPPADTEGEAGFIITNPPYGRRLGDGESAEAGYRDMAALIEHFPGWKLALISDHPGFESHFGKKADSLREIKSGAVETWLYEYEKL
jgi:putative N6-adenine-specific DNA methylase